MYKPARELDAWGQQLLESVTQVKQDILSALNTASGPSDDAFLPATRVVAAEGGSSQHSLSIRPRPSLEWNSHARAAPALEHQQPIPSAESILTWNVWVEELASLQSRFIFAHNTGETERPSQSRGTADTSISRMRLLGGCFERCVLGRYPVLRPARLRRHIFDVAESGGDWSAESCLVFLVGAIALRCSCCSSESAPASASAANQYWTMASRRIGWALDTSDRLLGIQCLCLAGFWHLKDCAPRKARGMFVRAAEGAMDAVRDLELRADDVPLAKYLHALCGNIARRLSNDLGVPLSDHVGRPLAIQEIVSHPVPVPEIFGTPQTTSTPGSITAATPPEQLSDMTAEIQDYDDVEKSMHLFVSSNPDCSSYRSVDAFLGHAAECRLRLGRLQHMWPVGFGQPLNVSVSREARNRRVTLLILRACLGLYLTPNLPDLLRSENGPGTRPQERLLSELAALANECVLLTSEALRSHLDTWSPEDDQQRASHSSPFQYMVTGVGGGGSSCPHLDAFLSHRAAYSGCLALLAVRFAKSKAAAGDSRYAHCAGLSLPLDWQRLVAGNKRVFMANEEDGAIWQSGQNLDLVGLE
ncbi:hypothetical protein F5X68DRAFT_243805 [Plectosphaerella plurivora]|uniref:Uncharacterized protein n=1 Tax=Plectosphaerella plurivora TaxID=936078 RepID=A0A9P9ACD2_9PEZI|nr:hypothetical protein F5X68DRAFT_243805 [Plectosphaerella plurivora]